MLRLKRCYQNFNKHVVAKQTGEGGGRERSALHEVFFRILKENLYEFSISDNFFRRSFENL